MIEKIQEAICKEEVDGWLFYNFRDIDPSANAILQIPEDTFASRRWFYFIPASGTPCKLVHKIEPHTLDHLPGEKYLYAGWQTMETHLAHLLKNHKTICMQYSPKAAVPYVSYVDAGTCELVKSCGVEVVSSANLIQLFEAVWSQEAIDSHNRSAQFLRTLVLEAFQHIRKCIDAQQGISEYKLQQFILERIVKENLEYHHAPIVAVNENAGDPHFSPQAENKRSIQDGDFVLIDLWGREKSENAVYADMTWMGYVGSEPTTKHQEVFNIVKQARDAAIAFIETRFSQNEKVYGYEVDDVTRNVINEAGYGEYFVHRTGHSIGRDLHWKGVNIDNLETKDERQLIEGVGFSIEPGIYMKDFGVRLEVNGYIHHGKLCVSAQPIQQKIIMI
ncbi:M24 family metallopeptidase [Candidatus Uabimicrobium amorphum]|uniref:Peptidase M24 n=1 Tax=Uabimicrobium amorphum TaxID=2596890 RepID=A0A5S9IKH2_UABAM|nr:M24 family metallopeptidase [Candidatus Uabimicrobium amorphum]BBM83539.1 peptidase M24 [Candidatus Uabimicrobium amorphum]